MSSTLVTALHQEERSIIAELRASKPFQRLEGVQRLLSLYDAKPSVVVSFGGAAEDRGAGAPIIQLAAPQSPAPAPIAMPGPVAATAEATLAEPPRAAPVQATATGAMSQDEASGVVSSVRAALLGIGKG
jgi:hypothetical protein